MSLIAVMYNVKQFTQNFYLLRFSVK